MALRISRRSWVLGRPYPLGAGRWGSMSSHSASYKSVEYVFLMRARVVDHHPDTTFHTASPRTPVNTGRHAPVGRGRDHRTGRPEEVWSECSAYKPKWSLPHSPSTGSSKMRSQALMSRVGPWWLQRTKM